MSTTTTTGCPTKETVLRLTELCRQGQFMEAINELYADDVESVEPFPSPNFEQVQKGIDAIRAKNEWWAENTEVHNCEILGPFPQPETGRFALVFKIDATCKMSGERQQMEEVALYTVSKETGKVIKEEFFYMPPEGSCESEA